MAGQAVTKDQLKAAQQETEKLRKEFKESNQKLGEIDASLKKAKDDIASLHKNSSTIMPVDNEKPAQTASPVANIGIAVIVSLLIVGLVNFLIWNKWLKPALIKMEKGGSQKGESQSGNVDEKSIIAKQKKMDEAIKKLSQDYDGIQLMVKNYNDRQKNIINQVRGLDDKIKNMSKTAKSVLTTEFSADNSISHTISNPNAVANNDLVVESMALKELKESVTQPSSNSLEQDSNFNRQSEIRQFVAYDLNLKTILNAINQMLCKKPILNATTTLSCLLENINSEPMREQIKALSPIVSLHYLDGSRASKGAELFRLQVSGVNYAFPHYSSFNDPSLANWYDIDKSASEFGITRFVEVSYDDNNFSIHCIEKGQMGLL